MFNLMIFMFTILHLCGVGNVIGSMILSSGFYTVIWDKSKEKMQPNEQVFPSSHFCCLNTTEKMKPYHEDRLDASETLLLLIYEPIRRWSLFV